MSDKGSVKKNREVLSALRKFQRIFHAYPVDGKKFDVFLVLKYGICSAVFFSLYFSGLVFYILQSTADFSDDMLPEWIEGVASFVHASLLASYVLVYLIVGNRIYATVDRISSKKFGRSKKLVEELDRFNRITPLIALSTMLTILGYIFFNYYFNVFCEARRITKDKRYFCGLLTPTWFPFVIESKLMKYIFVFGYSIGPLLYSAQTVSLAVVAIGTPTFLSIRLEDLTNQFQQMDHINVEDRPTKLIYLIKYHSDILRCIEGMNNSIGYCLFSQYSVLSLFIALTEFNIVISGSFLEAGCLILWIIMEIGMCYIGQILENKHTQLVRTVYNMRWYNMDRGMRLNYKIFLGKVQIPINFKAQPFVNINFQFLLAVFRGTYSLFMFLLNIKK